MKYNRPILLVEDNPMDVDLTRRAFSRYNVSNPIDVARDGEEALAFIQRWESGETCPVVVLLDVNLPKVNGLEVFRELRMHSVCEKIPVILLLSSDDDREALEKLSEEWRAFLTAQPPERNEAQSKEASGAASRPFYAAHEVRETYIVKPVNFGKFVEASARFGFSWTVSSSPGD